MALIENGNHLKKNANAEPSNEAPNGFVSVFPFQGHFQAPKLRHALRINNIKLMAKALTKSQIISTLAEKHGLTKKQADEIVAGLVGLAYKHAKDSFTIPGLGKLVLVNRKARMGRNPATGETIKIAAKRVVKFRVAKAAKDAILGKK